MVSFEEERGGGGSVQDFELGKGLVSGDEVLRVEG